MWALPSFPTRRSSDLVNVGERRWGLRHVLEEGRQLDVGGLGIPLVEVALWDRHGFPMGVAIRRLRHIPDRKSTRLNSSHRCISYAVFCLKKKKRTQST